MNLTFEKAVKGIWVLAIIILLLNAFLFLTGCTKHNEPTNYLAGNVYTYADSSKVFVAKFQKDSLFYFTYEDGQNGYQATPYGVKKLKQEDSYKVTVQNIPEWWDTADWDIRIEEDGIRSLRTGRFYKKEHLK
jgi:hypothetical protein